MKTVVLTTVRGKYTLQDRYFGQKLYRKYHFDGLPQLLLGQLLDFSDIDQLEHSHLQTQALKSIKINCSNKYYNSQTLITWVSLNNEVFHE